ncbi:MAG: cofactor-independent phosphoglycerate mutase [Acetivibrionales bacterium]|jgi:2,3-bisphosphoglycerate-independent phosphoglycerate mutase|nr:cofactor-independent phosphoglycerate mutase [Clostridiaceae bacterium]
MKYIVLLGDGMADWPINEIGGKTPLAVACKPNMDRLIKYSIQGLAHTIPEGMPAGSDVANLSVFGFDPKTYYTGRSPLEAISMGLKLNPDDTALRCNLVTLSNDEAYQDCTMVDYSAGEITTEESTELMKAVAKELNSDGIDFYPGISYRHCLVWKNGPMDISLTPPHDISGKKVIGHLPKGPGSETALALMKRSVEVLKDHPINKKRIEQGLNPATSIWLWGQGKKPDVPLFIEKYGLCGSVISAVDLIKGIGIASGMKAVDVPGATGNINTNFNGKAEAALKELQSGRDFVYVHVEAPDECGHQGQLKEKIHAIELIDKEVLGTLLNGLESMGDYRIMVLPDHPTPISIKTHSSDPVPFFIYDSRKTDMVNAEAVYTEACAKENGTIVNLGHTLMDMFLEVIN